MEYNTVVPWDMIQNKIFCPIAIYNIITTKI